MKELIAVFVGGGLGSLLRFGLGRWFGAASGHTFPIGTFAVNILACFMLGLIVGLADQKQMLSPFTRLFWAVGFCGGFSTFSTFSLENLQFMQTGQFSIMLLYIGLSFLVCLAATFTGQYLAIRM